MYACKQDLDAVLGCLDRHVTCQILQVCATSLRLGLHECAMHATRRSVSAGMCCMLTSCVKKYADSETILLCMRKRWMYSRLEASC